MSNFLAKWRTNVSVLAYALGLFFGVPVVCGAIVGAAALHSVLGIVPAAVAGIVVTAVGWWGFWAVVDRDIRRARARERETGLWRPGTDAEEKAERLGPAS